MADQDIIKELLSLEQFAITCEANLKTLRQSATRLRSRLGEVPSAGLESGLSIERRNKALSGRMRQIVKRNCK